MDGELAKRDPLDSPTGLSGSKNLRYAARSRTVVRKCRGSEDVGPVWGQVCKGRGQQRPQSCVGGVSLAIVVPTVPISLSDVRAQW